MAMAACAPHSRVVRAGDLRITQIVTAAPVVIDSLASTTMTVYLTIQNTGQVADTLRAVTSHLADSTEIHTMAGEGRDRHMATVSGVAVAPGKTVRFRPGGRHIMLEGLHSAPAPGDSVALVLTFSRAGAVPVTARVVHLDDLADALK